MLAARDSDTPRTTGAVVPHLVQFHVFTRALTTRNPNLIAAAISPREILVHQGRDVKRLGDITREMQHPREGDGTIGLTGFGVPVERQVGA